MSTQPDQPENSDITDELNKLNLQVAKVDFVTAVTNTLQHNKPFDGAAGDRYLQLLQERALILK